MAFDDSDLKRMNINCEKIKEVKESLKDEKVKEIGHESLPQKYVSGKNFVEEMFN